MRPILLLIPVLAGTALLADDPRAKPTDYPVHAESARIAVAAEYLVHSFGNGRQMYFVPGYLVIDTAIYPHEPLLIAPNQFALRINGKKVLSPEAPQTVGYSLTFNPTGMPQAPRPQEQPDPNNPDRELAPRNESATEVLVRTAFPQGEFHSPQGGYLYFAFGGSVKKIQSLELLYSGDGGPLTLKLF